MLTAQPTTTSTWWGPLSMVEPDVCAPIDANGNLTYDGTRVFEWDARNQLVAVTVGTHRSEYTYDGLQQRVRVVEKDNGVVQSDTRVVWCDDRICEERAADGSTVTRRAFARGEQVGGVARFFSPDHLGSVGEVTDTSNTLLARYAYDPWGRRTVTAGTDITAVGFTGHQRAAASELWLAMYRAYDSGLARWVSEDPAGLDDGPNLYAYVGGNPLNLIDPLGLSAESCEQDDPTPDPKKLKECLKACESTKKQREAFCRKLKNARAKALCWAAAKGSEIFCKNWCYYQFGD